MPALEILLQENLMIIQTALNMLRVKNKFVQIKALSLMKTEARFSIRFINFLNRAADLCWRRCLKVKQ